MREYFRGKELSKDTLCLIHETVKAILSLNDFQTLPNPFKYKKWKDGMPHRQSAA